MELRKNILIISYSRDLSPLFDNLKINYQLSIITINQISSIINTNRHYDLIIIDFSKQIFLNNQQISLISTSIYSKIIVLTSIIEPSIIENLYSLGIEDIIDTTQSDKTLMLKIKKHLNEYENTPRIIESRGVVLHTKNKFVKYKGCKVYLSNTEYILMEYLLSNSDYKTSQNIASYLSNLKSKEYSLACSTVLINRLNVKIFKGVGVRLIKSRYGFGYYLSI